MARFCPLASSSAGNCAYLSASTGAVLVDAGVSCRKIRLGLESIGARADEIQAVLITHEHIDHLRGLRIFIRTTGATVYATAPVLQYITDHGCVEPDAQLREVSDQSFCVAGMQVTPFATPHDSVGSVGYRFLTPDEHTLAVATDLGYVSPAVERGTTGCELVMLEANYDPKLLRMGAYPYYLKQRIASSTGHLENGASAAFARHLMESGTARMILAHLSRDNNNPALAHQAVDDVLRAAGGVAGVDYDLMVAPYDGAGKLVRF